MTKTYELFEGIVTNYGISRDDAMVQELYELLKAQDTSSNKPELTEAGLGILEYMQGCNTANLKAKDIAEGMGLASRKVSGSIRKLVTDGFVEKFGQNPVIYALTDKGRNFDIAAFKETLAKNEEE